MKQQGKDRVAFYDVHPKNKPKGPVVLYVPGFAADAFTELPSLSSIARKGRRAIAVDAPHGIPSKKIPPFTEAECREAAAILRMLDEKRLKKVDAIGHSAASLYLTTAALLDTKRRFRILVLLSPAGLLKHDSPLKLMYRSVKDAVIDMACRIPRLFSKTHRRKAQKESSRFIRLLVHQLPIVCHLGLTVSEIDTMGHGYIVHRLRQLRRQGIRIVIIQTTGDRMYPPSRLLLRSDCYDALLHVPGNHNGPIERPDFFMNAAVKAIEKIEQRKKQRS